MHEAAFSQAALPRAFRVLKMPLRPYSVGHAIWLWSRNNAFIAGPPPHAGGHPEESSRAELVRAVLICCHTHAQLLRLERGSLFLFLKMRIWGWRIRKMDIKAEAAKFRRYILEGSTAPENSEVYHEGKAYRSPGSPFILRLLEFLIIKMRLTEAAAMDYPLGLAKWHYCAYWESEQSLAVKNEGEYAAEAEQAAVERIMEEKGLDIHQAMKLYREMEAARA